ncbi:2-octaprenyl-3-methyl-6-methoxy-1,4-benzoquinol hydroxylase [Bisgaardia hudsonensis]|uniref:2-octaprenyl-3-methyl-6-methoxy-1,4-benzoquinol hydroxylase n=1 Tax=Bisgaardia hudsonensis TaxID=109472 RepID=A0A4R2MXG4_9PAST|nr:FAD-dependent monooxygenase [Bisgaardia hudsonensis]QLB12311.1 FAD-dependent 2-octaprenylphenol hydroxylase [Bisgaardia hudsonensis]TCP12357.1 2-octaprenyl-3-methyl-6-methoxy-1,4-benzoquinol hydroxylase [Bisgaardia hudsonensis]
MKTFDLAIVGGGMVGLALAASLTDSQLRIAVIEGFPTQIPVTEITNRVSALNLASQKMLEKIGVWQDVLDLRATAYDKMQVWEKDSFANIKFDTKGLGVSHLGHIVENHLIQKVLWDKVQTQKNVEIITALPTSLGVTESNAIVSLDNGEMLSSKLIVGADGANSWVRKQVDIPLIFRDYGHHALVCNVKTAESHQHCARQIFSKDSILAFLPLHNDNLCSIVWSLPPEQAKYLTLCDDNEFNKHLTVAFDNQLGLCEVQSSRRAIQLTARYARNFAKERVALVGDAAHTIHPLAGLGVNLGFQDAIALAQEIHKNLASAVDIGEYRYLRYYERWRKTEAVKMLAAMQGLKTIFDGDNPLKKLARGIGVTTTDKMTFVKELLIKQAMGI